MENKSNMFSENNTGNIISPVVDLFDQKKINIDPSPDYIIPDIDYIIPEDDYIIPDCILPDIDCVVS